MCKNPTIVVSRCLGFGVCRWNGKELKCQLVDDLKNVVNFIPVCPECEIALGMPRPPIRLVRKDSAWALIQPETGLDLTDKMVDFTENFLQSLPPVDGFLLKQKSPSCGLSGIPVYAAPDAEVPLNKDGVGFFAQTVQKLFSKIPRFHETSCDRVTFLKSLP